MHERPAGRWQRIAHLHVHGWLHVLFLCMVAGFVLRLPVLFQSVVDRDEGVYALVADEVLAGHLPYTTAFEHKPPAIYYLFALAQAAFGKDFVAIRLLGSACVALSAWALACSALRLGVRPLCAAVTAVAFLLLTLANGGLATNAEVVMMAPAHLGLTALLCALPGTTVSQRRAWLFAAGALMATAVMVKLMIAVELPAMVLIWLLGSRAIAGEGWRRRAVRELWWLAAGFGLTGAAWIAPHVVEGHGALLWRNLIEFNFAYAATTADIDLVSRSTTGLVPFAGIGAVVAVGGLRSRGMLGHLPAAAAIGCLAWLGACSFEVGLTGRYHDHYFLVLSGPLALLLGVVLHGAIAWEGKSRVQHVLVVAAVLGCVFMVGPWSRYRWPLLRFCRDVRAGDLYQHDLARQVAASIAGHWREGQQVYVYNYHPALYRLLGVRSPTPILFPDLITEPAYPIESLGVDRAAEVRRVLRQRPAWVVVHHWPGMFWAPTHDVVMELLQASHAVWARHSVPFHPGEEVVVYAVRP